MAFGYAEAAMAACVHTAARMQYSNAEIHSLQLPGFRGELTLLSFPHLCDSLGRGSAASRRL